MATGYRFRTEADSGTRILHAAGSLIAVLDDLLAAGGSPWTKTVNGTNDVTYQAPGGSQIKLRVYDNVNSTTSYVRRVNGQVGSGTVFPTGTQEANSSQGFCLLKVRYSNNTTAVNDARYVGIRTDRFMLLYVTESDTNLMGYALVAGDLPTIHGSDPGMCVVLGHTQNTTINTSFNHTAAGFIAGNNSTGGWNANESGYAELAPDGVVTPVPIGVKFNTTENAGASVADNFGKIVTGAVEVWSARVSTATSSAGSVLRATIPYLRSIDNNAGIAHRDTFSIGAANYIVLAAEGGSSLFALMTNDEEVGLP